MSPTIDANLRVAAALWLRRDALAVPGEVPAGWTWRLHHSRGGGLVVDDGALAGASIPLTVDPAGMPPDFVERWPHLAGHRVLRLADPDANDRPLLTEILSGQVVAAGYDESGRLSSATGVQLPGVLDDLFGAADRALGVSWADAVPTLAVWAPTAQQVALLITFADSQSAVRQPMSRSADGVWSVTGEPGWAGARYLFEVQVYVPAADAVLTNLVTDPYSVALTTNSAFSVIADLGDAALAPAGWGNFTPPPLAHPVDSAIYELHVRDLSAGDPGVPPAHRGGYLAVTQPGSAGRAHLRELAAAGLTTVHLLPTFDFSTVDDSRSSWQDPACDLPALTAADPAGTAQQECVRAVADRDGFNWGYDPWHYNVPEGSYATDPEGPVRTLEFRRLIAALGDIGLRVVLDVVYNHTVASGQHPRSVLDRIVPGYYHRLSATGVVENSTCCANTAAEHTMMTKLIVDSVLFWARQYKVAGFRFDLMGHHPKATMLAVRSALDSLTLAADGVDGPSLYVYGEGWNFGEVANNARFVQATQAEMAGTGIGTFNDRLRDAVRGGGPFDDDPRIQGFGSGLFTDPNGAAAPPVTQLDALLAAQDRIRIGLTGNLRDFPLIDRFGAAVTGAQVLSGGSPTGYTAEPSEVISYVDAHDNETLFDALALKLPVATSMSDRIRMNTLSLACVALGQGPMFWHAGADLLRSKSLDRNSFNSGDWFNRVDWTGQQNTFGSGLPPAADNQQRWPYHRPVLADPAQRPGVDDIAAAKAGALDLLRLRVSSRLLRLGSAALITQRLSFPGGGPDQLPGVILMVIDDGGTGAAPGANLDPDRDRLVVVFNATPRWQTVPAPDDRLVLHPVQRAGLDPIVRLTAVRDGAITVPPRTVAVLQS